MGQILNNVNDIIHLISRLVTKNTEIKVRIPSGKQIYSSRVVSINQDTESDSISKISSMTIGKMLPDIGNKQIQTTSNVILQFQLGDRIYKCSADYIGVSSSPPHFGFLLKIPKALKIDENRREERISYDINDFISAEFSISNNSAKNKAFSLRVIDRSTHGLGLVIDKKNAELIKLIKKGDLIEGMTLFASRSMIRIDCFVRYIAKIESGDYKGNFRLGVESKDPSDNFESLNG